MKHLYEVVYPDVRKGETEPSGGYVEASVFLSKRERTINFETAVLLAKQGYQIRLLAPDNLPGHRNPDALFIREQILVEFKRNQTPTSEAVDKELRKAKKQARYVVLHVCSTIRKGHLLKALKSRVRLAPNIRGLWLIWKKDVYHFNRDELLDGTIDRKIQ
jgi:hypothetical protein